MLIFAFYHLEYFTLISRFQLKYLHKIENKIKFYENDHIQNHIVCRWIYQKRLTRQNNLKMQFAL